jgi:membrane fusion protein (multidrug efflux system)
LNRKTGLAKKKIAGRGLLIVFMVTAGAAYWWVFEYNRIRTDDAYAWADSAQVGSRMPGTILQVALDNDDFVRVGRTLLELDPAVYKTALREGIV